MGGGLRRRQRGLLRALLSEAGWSGEDLARSVNRIGAEAGLSLRYGRASVAQWATGAVPRPPVPALIAEALTRRLGRPVTPRQALPGLAGQPGNDHRAWPWSDPATQVRWLASASRHGAAGNSVFHVAGLSVPDWPAAIATADRPLRSAPVRIGSSEVESASTTLEIYSQVDLACGGGMVRPAAFEFLSGTVVGWLRTSATLAVRRALLSVAARWAYLCGFLCFDDGLHGLAQRCYQTALRLAADAGDAGSYATTLRTMSVQAYLLGHAKGALALAEAAVTTIPDADPGASAFLHGQLAVAQAATGDRARAVASLHRAERQLDLADNLLRPLGAYHPAALAHQRAAVCASLGDRDGAITALTDSVSGRPPGERRAHAVTLAWLAELQLGQGHLEEALARWHAFCDLYPSLRSGRVRSALAELRARLRPYRRHRPTARLLSRADRLQQGRYE